MNIVELKGVSKKYGEQIIFDNYNVNIERGSFTVIIGESGSGKSTLLNMIGLLEKSDSGIIVIDGEKAPKPFSVKSSKILRDKISYLFQNFGLIDDRNVFYNLNLVLDGNDKKLNEERCLQALQKVGLTNITDKLLASYSGGEQQRIALARVILKKSDLVLCDEPTGNLDDLNVENVFSVLKELHNEDKRIVVVTHDIRFLEVATKTIELKKFEI